MTSIPRWLFGTQNVVLSARIGVVLVVVLAGALAGVLLLRLPIWTFGILGLGVLVTFRIAVQLGLYVAKATARPPEVSVVDASSLSGSAEVETRPIDDFAASAKGIWSDRPDLRDTVAWVRASRESFSRRTA